MKLEEIGNIKVMEPSISVKDFFSSVMNITLFEVKEDNIDYLCENKSNIIYEEGRVTFRENEGEDERDMNSINEVKLCVTQEKCFMCDVSYSSDSDEYVKKIMGDKKNYITVSFFSIGAVISQFKKYEASCIWAFTFRNEEEKYGVMRIFFKAEKDKIDLIREEMESYFQDIR